MSDLPFMLSHKHTILTMISKWPFKILIASVFVIAVFLLFFNKMSPLIIDSQMMEMEIFDGLPPSCPEEIRARQRILVVKYYSFDGRIHQGQIVVDSDVVDDVEYAFQKAFEEKFPIFSVIPISHKDFRKDGIWSDDLSMEKNNSSAFNYRFIAGKNELSLHSYGWAVDINPMQNPYLRDGLVLPTDAVYDESVPGTLTHDSAIVKAFIERGWEWGGDWQVSKGYLDCHHFQKKPKKTEDSID